MTCGYCGSRRYSGDTRCRTCGCRADDSIAGEGPTTQGALATQPRIVRREVRTGPAEAPADAPVVTRRGTLAAVPRQDALFQEPMGPKVVAIAPSRPRPKQTVGKVARKPLEQMQGKLDFVSQPPTRKMLSTTVEATIYCEDPVATVWHRAIAASLDWSMVAIAYGIFMVVFHFMGGSFDFSNKVNLMAFGGMLALIGITYGGMWALMGRDSAGMRWTQLQITTFDGFTPEPRQRILRFAGSCLSLCTVVGLLWSLADEESLTWQDHMSGTFPTPVPLSPGARRS